MVWRVSSTYNDACNCHPEDVVVEAEGDTLEELAEAMANAEAAHQDRRFDLDEVRQVSGLDAVEEITLAQLLPVAREKAAAKAKAAKEAEAREVTVRGLKNGLRSAEAELERVRADLNADAIARREADIRMLRVQLLALGAGA